MDELEIGRLVADLDTANVAAEARAWGMLRVLGDEVVPYLEAAYPKASTWQRRLSLVFHAIPFARTSEAAVRLGVTALNDRSHVVRWRACGLLAYSQRRDALAALKPLLRHADPRTAADARAAVDAIKERNHHLFVDRDRTGRVFWEVRQPGSDG